MSPVVFRWKGYRVFFFSKEEPRIHVHVVSGNGDAKFWIEPVVELADNYGLNAKEIKEIQTVIEERRDEIVRAWRDHFSQ
jgi:hypothetical protein